MNLVSMESLSAANAGRAQDPSGVAREFLGATFFRTLMRSMRKTVPESTFFNSYSGRVFQDFLDDELAGVLAAGAGPLLEQTARVIGDGDGSHLVDVQA